MAGAIDLQKATDNITQLVGMCAKQDFHKAVVLDEGLLRCHLTNEPTISTAAQQRSRS